MKLTDFDYDLPKNLIAQKPVRPRDHSRLLVLERNTGKIRHEHFYDVLKYLKDGDVLVLNNTKVMPARLIGKKAETGGKVEVFLLRNVTPFNPPLEGGRIGPLSKGGVGEVWQCLIGGKKRKENLRVAFPRGLKAEILENNQDGTWNVKFNRRGPVFMKIIEKIGRVPLPPYVKRSASVKASADKQNYQTVYADDKKIGSVAAPTAGLHFTEQLIGRLKKKGVQFESVTLQVGLGTFAPVKVDDITEHKMHEEWVEIDKKTLSRIIKAKREGRRIVAVGTTSVRTLESVFKNYSSTCHCEKPRTRGDEAISGQIQSTPDCFVAYSPRNDKNYYGAWTDIFIYPGYKFKMVDAMITNFHLPKSTLIILVSAFAEAPTDKSALAGTSASLSTGREKVFKAYRTAIKKQYRFYSYGDAMLII